MPFVKIWIHAVWPTKNRTPFLVDKIRQTVFQHMFKNAREKGIYIDHINGYTDHCHCLISMGIDQSLSKLMQLIKGESSHWINQQNIADGHFEWQNDYFAVSVSESMVDKVRVYIRNQENHHAKKSFQEEYDDFINKYGFNVGQ